MSPEQAHQELMRAMRRAMPEYLITGTVDEVTEKYTCTVTPDDGQAKLYGCRLRASIDESELGIIPIPVKGSGVTVGMVRGNDAQPVVLQCSDVERVIIACSGGAKVEVNADGTIVLNGGSLGGLVKINTLVTNLNRNVAMLSAIKSTFSGWTPISMDGGAALKTAMNLALSGKNPGDFSGIENTNVTHG